MISLLALALITTSTLAHEFGTKATGTIPCSDANINNEGCWECYKNNEAPCEAKKWGKKGMVPGVCTGKDSEYWNYICVEAAGGETQVGYNKPEEWTGGHEPCKPEEIESGCWNDQYNGGCACENMIFRAEQAVAGWGPPPAGGRCDGLTCSSCLKVPGSLCSFADGSCWDSQLIPMTARSFARSLADCSPAKEDSAELPEEYDFADADTEGEEAVGGAAMHLVPQGDCAYQNSVALYDENYDKRVMRGVQNLGSCVKFCANDRYCRYVSAEQKSQTPTFDCSFYSECQLKFSNGHTMWTKVEEWYKTETEKSVGDGYFGSSASSDQRRYSRYYDSAVTMVYTSHSDLLVYGFAAIGLGFLVYGTGKYILAKTQQYESLV